MSVSNDDDGEQKPLARIARTLGMPIEAFFQADDDRGSSVEAEEMELVALFRELRDPRTRRRCLDLVRAMARPANGRSGDRS